MSEAFATYDDTLRLIQHLGVDGTVNYLQRLQVLAHDNGIRPEDLICYFDVQEKGEAAIVGVMPLLFTHAIVSGINAYGYEDRWCYESYAEAKAALDAWDGTGEPNNWHRHPPSGRRRDKDGNETVNW